MSQYIQTNQIVELPGADSDISISDSGKTLLVVDAITYTLPPVQSGLQYRFLNNDQFVIIGDITINTFGADLIYGIVVNGPTKGISLNHINGDGHLLFVGGESLIGDFMDFISDGTHWYVYAKSSNGEGIV